MPFARGYEPGRVAAYGLGLDHEDQTVCRGTLVCFGQPVDDLVGNRFARQRGGVLFRDAGIVEAEDNQTGQPPAVRPFSSRRIDFVQVAMEGFGRIGGLEKSRRKRGDFDVVVRRDALHFAQFSGVAQGYNSEWFHSL